MTKLEALEELLSLNQAGIHHHQPQPVAADFLAALSNQSDQRFLGGSWVSPALSSAIRRFVRRPDVEAREALRFLQLAGDLKAGHDAYICAAGLEHLEAWWDSHGRSLDLLGFAKLWKGKPDDFLLGFQDKSWCYSWPRLQDEFLVAYLRDNLRFLLGSIGVSGVTPPPHRPLDWSAGPQRALKLLARLRPLPPESLERLWELALGEARGERELAQDCVRAEPGWQKRLLASLRLSQAGPRQRAAEWAGRERLAEALPLLTAALQKEKVEKCRLAQMEALKLLGAPLETYLNRAGLLAEARATLAKGRPDWLGQVPLPALRWQDGGEAVERELLQGLVMGAVRLKSPEPSAWLETICAHFSQPQAWGEALLAWWIARDTAGRLSPEQVEAALPARVEAMTNFYRLMGQTRPAAAVEAEVRRSLSLECEGSAIDLKGILALAGACGGLPLVGQVQAYLKEWYGLRSPQCKALVAMLAHLDALEAVQYLLAVARRFRTKGIQEEAHKRLRERAERLGWTLDDMADLSLPDGGIEEDGTLPLDYGDREVRMQLQPDNTWIPKAPPKGGDPDKVKEASKRFKAAQKTVKEVGKSVADRLYDAMCSGRSWPYLTWETCLLNHSLARRVCQRLVWKMGERTFRPTEDGTFIDAEHQRVSVDRDGNIALPHPLHLSEPECQAWSAHLTDYLLIPPFPQLGRKPHQKPPEPGSDFLGHLLTSFDLRNRAKALGYERAPAVDGGVFTEYRKSLGTSGWTIRIQFSGSELPETQHPVALEGFTFDFQDRPAAQAEVPDVLWSEAYNDMEDLSRAGPGFDPDWARKVSVR